MNKQFVLPGLIGLSTAALFALSSCANYNPYSNGVNAKYSQNGSGTADGSNSSMSCPSGANVHPNDPWMTSLPGGGVIGHFTVCHDGSKLKVSGALIDHVYSGTTDTTVCVFPALSANGYLLPIPEVSSGGTAALHQCHPLSNTAPTDFDFTGTTLQGVFIVEARFMQQMNNCLVAGTPVTCPHYVAGQPMVSGYWSYGVL